MFLAELKLRVVHGGKHVRVRDLLDTEMVQCLHIQLRFALLELWNGNLSVVNGQEFNQLLEILNLLIFDLEGSLKGQNRAFLGGLGLKDRLQSLLTLRKIVKLLLIRSLLVLSSQLCLHHVLSSDEAVIHSLNVEILTLQPDVGFIKWVLDFQRIFSDLCLDVLILWIGQCSL